jgi:diguanylate cyclase (GGDEF)-like protein
LSPSPDQPIRSRSVQQVATALAFCLLYFLVDSGLNRFAFSNGWTILWPLNGVTIALLIMRPRNDWPAMLLGVEVGVGLGEYLDGNALGPEIWQRIFSLIEVVVSAALLPPFSNLEEWLRQPRIFARFLASLFLGPTISGIMAAIYFHILNGQAYLSAFDDWATADALGIAAVMPLALSISSNEMRALFRRPAILKTFGVLALALASAAAVFSVSRYPLLFLLFPALLFVDSMLAFAGTAIAVVGISLIAVYMTTHAIGPFGLWPHDLWVTRDVAMQIYLGFHLVALFPASIMMMERRRLAAELHDTNDQLLLLASLDGLTGVANRRSLDERFSQEWNRAIRLQTPLALIMIDIDHFKQFNDLYGHHAGDQCLQTVARALRGEIQRVQDHLARFGGEEFALLLPHTDTDGALHMAEKLRTVVMELAIEHRGSAMGRITVSLGCAAMVPAQGEESVILLQLADAALYEAKRTGRNRARITDPSQRRIPA